ncbi:protein-L-isoaspartate O-methyltransferase family protein [Natronobiforma cellulositropha]|uniref:protein-L-isoaspartate O-methyltransferase family protein n=1 Tax=Natronobiforma cellulositropha TaxID=1679076 RepID=UPI0021D5E78A|nr:protein-L-isoaspartate O-methyltransferase [Natronobiforma cellulositropha]
MEFAVLREDMVDSLEHETKAVLEDHRVGVAMREVPRHEFVPDERVAYADRDYDHLGTRILAPSTAAKLLQALEPSPGDSVLVVGAGVGYTAAVAAELVGAAHVHAVDIARPVVYEARENLARAGYGEVLVDCRDGARGLPEYAPFDRILVEAGAIAPPRTLLEQLAPDGRLVYPRGAGARQRLESVARDGTTTHHGALSFDPLLVEGEQSGALERNRTAREDTEYARRHAETRRGWEQGWLEWD